MSAPIFLLVPVTKHIHILQQQLFWLSRVSDFYPNTEFHFFVENPHPVIQEFLMIFHHTKACHIFDSAETNYKKWIAENYHSNGPVLFINSGAIPNPHLIDELHSILKPTRMLFDVSKHTAGCWLPDSHSHTEFLSGAWRQWDSEEGLNSYFAEHDGQWMKWPVFKDDIGHKVPYILKEIFSFDHADVTGKEGNQFLSDALKSRLSIRQKAVSKIKKMRSNVLFHPLSVEQTSDGEYRVNALQENMIMGNSKCKAARFSVEVHGGAIHTVSPKPIKLDPFPNTGPLEVSPKTFRPISLGQQHRLIFSTIMRNEADKFLSEVISHAAQYVDGFVVIDDCSEDNSIDVFREAAGSKPVYIHSPSQPLYVRSEFYIRSLQWALSEEMNPEWVLLLDADERFENKILDEIDTLLSLPYDRIGFPKFDMWNSTHYRDDDFWCPQRRFWPHLIRFQKEHYQWSKVKVHCGRHPIEYLQSPVHHHPLRIQHLGWSRESERRRKYDWYMQIDEKPADLNESLYQHIMDSTPTLKAWSESDLSS